MKNRRKNCKSLSTKAPSSFDNSKLKSKSPLHTVKLSAIKQNGKIHHTYSIGSIIYKEIRSQ